MSTSSIFQNGLTKSYEGVSFIAIYVQRCLSSSYQLDALFFFWSQASPVNMFLKIWTISNICGPIAGFLLLCFPHLWKKFNETSFSFAQQALFILSTVVLNKIPIIIDFFSFILLLQSLRRL